MWDWYNRPGSRSGLPTRTVILIVVGASALIGAFFMLFYILVAPFLFTPVPVR